MSGKVLVVFSVTVLIAVAIGFYVVYRDSQTAKAAHLTSLTDIQGIPPTICTYKVAEYGGGSGGSMYIANDRIRIDVPDLEQGAYSGSAEAVIGMDGTRLIDPSSEHSLSVGNGVSYALNMIITQAPWKCDPWWFSDNALFNIPNAVTF